MTVDLDHHGDDDLDPEARPGQLDLAVNVRLSRPPAWLQARLRGALAGLAAYPRPAAAREAVAARHGRDPAAVLLTNGAAEAFTLLARGLRPRRAVCVHPSFTAPEAALRAAGHRVERVLLAYPFELDPDLVPADADLVVLGNPTNPTARLHPVEVLERLARPGRVLVVDEAFADAVAGEPASLAARRDLPGLVVVRSLTKTWGLAGLRVGYLLADPELAARLATAQPPWPVNSLALEALVACSEPGAVAWADDQARQVAAWRARPDRRPRPAPRGQGGPRRPGAVPAAARPGGHPGPGPPARPGHRGPPGRHLPRPGPRLAARRRGRPRAPRPHPRRLLPEPPWNRSGQGPSAPARRARWAARARSMSSAAMPR